MKAVFSCLFLLWVPLLWAAPLPQRGVGLDQLLEVAERQNPRLVAAQAALGASQAKVQEAQGWEPTQLKVQQFIEPIETRLGPQDRIISISQKLPFPGWTSKAEDAAQLEAQAAEYRLKVVERKIRRDVKATYYDLWQFAAMPELLGEIQEVIERLVQMGSIESQRNQNLLDSIFEAQARAGESAYQLLEMQDRLTDAQVRLNHLLGRGGEPLVEQVAAPPLPHFERPLEPLIDRALAQYPGLLALQAQAQADRLKAQLEGSKANAPALELGINYFQIGPSANASLADSGKDAYNLSLGISLPWGSGKNQGRFKAAQFAQERSASEYEEMAQQVREQVAQHYNHVVNAQRMIKLFEEKILPPARRAGSLNERLYSAGQKNIGKVLMSKAQLLDLEVRYLKAQAAYLKSLTDLEEWVGVL
ncbi:MAG: TolC family protein [bacterium]|nr:TolC family protein [bacterium]